MKVNPKRVYRSRMNPDGTHRLCAGCSDGKAEDDNTRWIPIDQFYKRSNGFYKSKCKACSRTSAKERYLSADGERDRARARDRRSLKTDEQAERKRLMEKRRMERMTHKMVLYHLTVSNPRTGEEIYYIGKTKRLAFRVMTHKSNLKTGNCKGSFKWMHDNGFTRIKYPEGYQPIPASLGLKTEAQAIAYYRELYGKDRVANKQCGSYVRDIHGYGDPALHRLFFMYCNPKTNKKYR